MKKKNENIKKKKIKSPPFTSVKKELLNALPMSRVASSPHLNSTPPVIPLNNFEN